MIGSELDDGHVDARDQIIHAVAAVLGQQGHSTTWQFEPAALIEETQAQADAVQAKIPKPISSAKLSKRATAESSRPTQIEPMSWATSGSEREKIKSRSRISRQYRTGCSGRTTS